MADILCVKCSLDDDNFSLSEGEQSDFEETGSVATYLMIAQSSPLATNHLSLGTYS